MTSKSGRERFFLFRWIDLLSMVSGYLGGLAIALAMLTICQAVMLRYLFGVGGAYAIELSIYLLIFATFVGGAYGLKNDSHVGVDLVTNKLPSRARAAVKLVGSLLALALVIVVAWRAYVLWWDATEAGWNSNTAWGPPLTYPYFILPLGMTLIALQYLVVISGNIQQLAGRRTEDSDQTDAGERAEAERAAEKTIGAD